MSYKIVSLPMNFNSYGPRNGLEGPFLFNGFILYYDPKEGKYYDPINDFYLSNEEFQLISG